MTQTPKQALKHLVEVAIYGNKENNRGHIFDAENILKELVERDTPMKVEHRYKLGKIIDYYCPNCSVYICFSDSVSEPVKYQHCPECGQRLGWEEC